MTETRVVHLRREPYDVRIDRKTDWGNPFRIPQDGNRAQVIAKYRQWITEQPDLCERARRELRGKVLGCWCHPLACHGEVLAQIADSDADPWGEDDDA